VITGNASKMYDGDQYFEKGEYDYIFDVDYDGVPRKLPFNEGENVLEAAEKFLAREGLGRAYVEQICTFIRITLEERPNKKKLPYKRKTKKYLKNFGFIKVLFVLIKTTLESKYFPMNKYVLFENMNLQGIE
jgi:PFU (PLAA family ubiquitin binding)